MEVKLQKEVVDEVLIIPTGRYVDILETQIHGDRVRGRICWGEEVVETKKLTYDQTDSSYSITWYTREGEE